MDQISIVRLASRASCASYDQVADLHISSIFHGLLPLLGKPFLSRLYLEIDRTPGSGVWGAFESDRIVGFLAGSANARKTYRSLLSRASFPLAAHAGRALFTWPVLRRIPQVVAYPFRRPGPSAKLTREIPAELLAVAVRRGLRRKGVGLQLVEVFEKELVSWGVRGRYRVATNLEDQLSNRFYEKAGFERTIRVSHNDLTLQVYEKDLSWIE